MAGLNVLLKIIIIFTTCATLITKRHLTVASRLNVPRVLLPIFNDFPVNFTLEVTEGGCYQWSTSRLDILNLIPINENPDHTCSSGVMVQSITRDSTRNTAIVLAEDINTRQFLRCDVIVDTIESLNLVTTTRELFIEEAPEAFEVRAYDEQGNEFTTLAGVEFIWTLENGERHTIDSDLDTSDGVLRFMTFQESPYETPTSISMLDGTGRKGSIILLEGVKTGTAKVSARLPYPEYRHVPSVEVELIVVANLIILPTDVTLMAYDSFNYKIMQVHQGRLEDINLSSSQYYLEAEDPEILEIDDNTGKAYALCKGRTKVLLHDKNVNDNYGIVLPTATVHVNTVEYITITVLPHRNRGLILGETHEIVVELFDEKDHKFYIGDGVEVLVNIDEKFIDTKMISKNGTYIVGVPITCGTTTVEAQLHGVIDSNGNKVLLDEPLVAKTDLVIHTPVMVNPKLLAVPWDPHSKTRLDVALKATGGDGTYVWNSRGLSIATVSQAGVVRILNQGSTEIIVSMARNQHNHDKARVLVMLPTRLEIIQYSMDAATGEPIYLHVALYGKLNNTPDAKEMPFTDCRDTSFEVYISDNNFVRNATSEYVQQVGISCATLTVIGREIGSSSVTVAYKVNEKYLMDNVTVSAYEPLIPVHPSTAETLLAVGSSRKIIFKGGPAHPGGKHHKFTKEITITDEEIIKTAQIDVQHQHPDLTVYEITCRALGEVTLTLKIFNEPILPNCRSTGATSTVKIICGKPRYVYLQPEFKDRKNCPIGNKAEQIMAHTDQPLRLIVIVKDEDGKQFDNFTSLNVEWTLKPSGSGLFEVSSGTLEETFKEFNLILPKIHYQTIIPKKHTGSLIVTAKISDYQKYILSKLRIAPEWPPFPVLTEKGTLATPKILAELKILLVNDTVISPSRIKLINDPNAKYSLQVSQGSGYYQFMLSTNEIADVRYVEPTRTISIIPKSAGLLQIALVDLCLDSNPAIAEIEVQQLAGIEVNSINKVEKGKCISAEVRLFDTNSNLIELPSLDAFDLKYQVDNSFVELKRSPIGDQGDPPYSRILYMIHGLNEGESRLSFTSSFKDQETVRSDSIGIQVFVPLKITQKNVTILVGTIYQVLTTGGPTNAQIEFSVDDEDIVAINSNGIFEGKAIGNTRISARALGPDNRVIYSQDFVDIYVTELQGIKIVAPTTRIKVGATIPLWAFGIPDQLTPLIIGSLKSLLVFSWTSSDTTSLYLHSMYEETGINIRYQNEVTLRAKALKAGLATIYLNVTIPTNVLAGFQRDITFNTFIKIEVIEELTLIHPDLITGAPVILMTPNSSLKLRTNRDNYGVSTYRIILSGNSYESDDPNALILTKSVSVDKNGVLKSGESIGRTILSITNTESYNRKQSLTVVVDVKPVHYMMLSLSSNVRIREGEELNILPKGMELNYVVDFFDNLGAKFHAADIKFNTISNRADLITFYQDQNNQLNVKFQENGELVAKIFSEKYPNGIFDYAHMVIGDIIFPSKTTLTVGDIICFSMPLLSSETGDPGFWQSSNPDVLAVDPLTGIGRTKKPGQVIVKHSLTSHKQGEIEINVESIYKISLVLLKGKNITGMEIFSLPLVLKNKDEGIKENNVLARGLGGCRTRSSFTLDLFPFTCNIQFVPAISSINIKDIFITKPRFDIVSGFYYCDIIPIGIPTLQSSTLEAKIQINAYSRDVEGKSLEIIYLPPVYVTSTDVIFVQNIPQAIGTSTVKIHGLQSVLEQMIIQVPEGIIIHSRELIGKNLLHIDLRLVQDKDDIQGQKIILINELTKQNVSLLIRISRYDEYHSLTGFNLIECLCLHSYMIISFAIIIITMFWMWRNKIASVDLSVKNTSVFASPPPLKKSPIQNTQTSFDTTLNNSMNQSSSSPRRSPESPHRPFSAFQPVYGDPRGFYTPSSRRNISFHCP